MSLKISELTASSGITADDLIPIVNDPAGSPQTLKATGQQFLDYVTGSTFNQLNVQSTTEQITLQALDNDIDISAQEDINIEAEGRIRVDSADYIDLVAVGNIYLDSQADTYIESGGQIYISSSNPVTITSRLSGTTSEFVEVTASVVSASTYVGLPLFSGSGLPNGPDTSLQFRSGSDFAGSADLVYDYNLGILSGTYAEFTEITASIISASSYVGIPSPSVALEDLTDVVLTFPVNGQILKYNGSNWVNSTDQTGSGGGTPGGANTAIQFNSGSTFSGSTSLVYDYSSGILSGTIAKFTTITSSNIVISGGNVAISDAAYVEYLSLYDKVAIYPGLYVSGALTASAQLSGTSAAFTAITASIISASTYVGIPNVTETYNKIYVSSSTSLSSSERVVFATNNLDSNLSITLPSVVTADSREYYIIKADSLTGSVFVSGNITDTINGQNVYELNGPYQSVTLINDGTGSWYVF